MSSVELSGTEAATSIPRTVAKSVIEVTDVSKRFRIWAEKSQSLKGRVLQVGKASSQDFWALRDVNVEIAQGETLGLIGHNGSGKSTLLKCIAGILRPTSGRVRTVGRIASLLELGAGFHPELTGRDNVYLNGSILGLTRREVERRFDDIVGFAEVEPFIDNPIKQFSSGMQARLGFAVAVNVEPEVLLVDEVLSVGDEAFQRKCIDRVRELQREGRTILFVTHAADLVRQICDRALVLDHGRIVMLGPPSEAVQHFRELMHATATEPAGRTTQASMGVDTLRFIDVQVSYPEAGRANVMTGEHFRIDATFTADVDMPDVVCALQIVDRKGNVLLSTNTDRIGVAFAPQVGRGHIELHLSSVPLLDGEYFVSVGLLARDGQTVYDYRHGVERLVVVNPMAPSDGIVHFDVQAEVVQQSGA